MLTRRLTAGLRAMSTEAKPLPYDSIPAVPGGWVPIIGNIGKLVQKPGGFGKVWKNLLTFKETHGKPDVPLLRFHSHLLSPRTGRFLVIYDVHDIEHVYRAEGKHPERGPAFEAFRMMRQRRPEIFWETTGVLMEEGEKWHWTRSKVQQDLMRPKSALFYIDELQDVSQDFVNFIRAIRDPDDHTVNNFLPDIYRFTFEAVTLIALDTRLGCLKLDMDPEIAEVFQCSQKFLAAFPDIITALPTWKFFGPRFNKVFADAEDNLGVLLDFGAMKIQHAIWKIEAKANAGKLDDTHETSVLEKMILRNGKKSTVPIVMAIDMIFAGIDTTGNTLAFFLYNMAVNPEIQEKLRKECFEFDEKLTAKDLDKMKFYKACMKESQRLTPTFAGMGRITAEDTVISGYHVPKDTSVFWNWHITQRDESQFPDWEQFKPDRWIKRDNGICPYANLQFSKGPRMCIGKRFAELELQLVIHRLLRNFKITWTGPEPLTLSQVMFNTPDQLIDLKFEDIKR